MATIDTHTFVTNFNADNQETADIELMTDERGHLYPLSHLFGGATLGNALQVVEPGELGRFVKITKGYIQIPFSDYAYFGWLEEDATLNIEPNIEVNPRYSAIVAYIKRDIQYDSSVTNNPGLLRITEVQGTAASTPSEVGEQAIKSEIGDDNPFVVLAQVFVPSNATSITRNNISDKRTGISLKEGVQLPSGSFASGITQASGSSYTNPVQIAVINANDTVPSASPDADLLVCRISQ